MTVAEPEIIQDYSDVCSTEHRSVITRGYRVFLCLTTMMIITMLILMTIAIVYATVPQSDYVTIWLLVAFLILTSILMSAATINSIYIHLYKRDNDLITA